MTANGEPRLCLEPGCDLELERHQRKFCGDTHAAAYRQRHRRRRLLEERALGPRREIDDLVLKVVDTDSLAELVDDLTERDEYSLTYRDDDPDVYRGVATIRAVAEILREAEGKHIQRHILPFRLLA